MEISRRTAGATLLAAVLGLTAGIVRAQPPEGIEAFTRAADLVFRGTVQRVGAANLKAVAPGEDTAVVRIEELLKGADDVKGFVGREVTVKLRAPRSAKVGERAVFFANTWLWGESLGVVEVGRVPAGRGVRAQVAAAAQRMREDEVRDRVASSDLVVTGRVVETRPAGIPSRLSEHDPQWAEAVIQVDAVLKGTAAADRVVLFYPTSLDVAWYQAPKPQVGWDGVWLLRRGAGEELRARGAVFTALEPWTVMSREDASLVRKLVRP
jgi:hypothetical protein